MKKLLNYLLDNGKCEDFINTNYFCQKQLWKGHKYYFVECDLEDKIINIVFDNVKDFVKFNLNNYDYDTCCGSFDKFEDIQEFINTCQTNNQKIVFAPEDIK